MRTKGPVFRRAPVSIGVLSLLMTAVYVPGLIVGWFVLYRGLFEDLLVSWP